MTRPATTRTTPALTLVAAWALAPALLACASPQAAPTPGPPAPLDSQDAQGAHDAQAAQDSQPSRDAQAAATRAALVQRLADIELILDVEGDVEAARTELLLAAADIGKALSADEAAELLERVAAIRARLDARPVAEASPDLRETVLEAVDLNHMATLEQLGSRAVDVLAAELRKPEEQRDSLPDTGQLLFAMMRLDQHRTLWLVRELERIGRPLSQEVLFVTMHRADVLDDWVYVPGRTPSLLEPGWLDVFADMLGSPAFVARSNLWGNLASVFRDIIGHDAVTPELTGALARHTRPTDAAFVRLMLGSVPMDVQWASVKPLLSRLCEHPDAAVRSGAAWRLAMYQDSEAVRALADDPSADVRVAVARLFRWKDETTVRWTDRTGRTVAEREKVAPEPDEDARRIVGALMADPEPRVREEAVHSAAMFVDEPLALETYEPLVDDPDLGVRLRLVESVPSSLIGAEDLLLHLVRSGDAAVLDAVVRRLDAKYLLSGESLPRFLTVLSATSTALGDAHTRVDGCWAHVVRQPEGAALLLTEAVHADNLALVDRVVDGWGSGPNPDGARMVLGLDADVLVDVLRAIERRSQGVFSRLVDEARRSASPGAVKAMRLLAEDARLDPMSRLLSVSVSVAREGPDWEAQLLSLLSSDVVKGWRPDGSKEWPVLQPIANAIPEADRCRVLGRILTESGLPDRMLVPLLVTAPLSWPGGEVLALGMLERWHDEPGEHLEGLVHVAMTRLEPTLWRDDPELMIDVARGPHHDAALVAVRAMGRSRDPGYLPVLRDCLQTSWLPAHQQSEIFDAAVKALTNYMDDAAAEILLDGAAAAPDAHLRRECMVGVKAIDEYQRARAEWEQRDGARATRDEAVAELVRMLPDEDATVRAECLRALGVLGAVEQLPLVIRFLKDPDRDVRAAAREALDRLNALQVPAAGQAAGEPPPGAEGAANSGSRDEEDDTEDGAGG